MIKQIMVLRPWTSAVRPTAHMSAPLPPNPKPGRPTCRLLVINGLQTIMFAPATNHRTVY